MKKVWPNNLIVATRPEKISDPTPGRSYYVSTSSHGIVYATLVEITGNHFVVDAGVCKLRLRLADTTFYEQRP